MRLVMENLTKGLLIALSLCGTCGLALAGSNTGSLSIPATVAQTCSVSATSTLAFGAYDPVVANASSALTGTGSVSIKCTKGSSGITVDLDAGAHVSGTQRRLQGATVTTDFLNYGITQPATTSPWTSCAGSTVWGSTDRKSTRLNSSHLVISYAVFCLKKKKTAAKSSSLIRTTKHA